MAWLDSVQTEYRSMMAITRVQKAVVEKPADWLRITAEAEEYSIPDGELATGQLNFYRNLSWVQIAVNSIASLASTSPFGVLKVNGEKTENIENHPFELLLRRPNPLMSRHELLEATISHYALTGNAYWWLNKKGKGAPDEIWMLPSQFVKPVPDAKMFLKGYLYEPEGASQPLPIDVEEIVHFRRFNPFSQFVGLSPIEALSLVSQGDINMQKYNANYFDKGNVKTSGILAFSDPIDDVSWQKMKQDMDSEYGGTKRKLMRLRNAGKGGVQWIPTTMSQKDVEFLSGRTFTKEEIFAMYAPGLASMLAVNATEANSIAGRKTFIELGVWPNMVKIAEKISNDLLPLYGENLVGEFDDIRVTDRTLELQEQAAYERTHTIDEVRGRFYQDGPLADDTGVGMIGGGNKETKSTETILGYHIETGVVTRNEARAPLGLPAIDESKDVEQRDLRAKLELMTAAKNAGLDLEQAVSLIGLDIKVKPEQPAPVPSQFGQPQQQPVEPPANDIPVEDAPDADKRAETKALRKWLKKRGVAADLTQFDAEHLDEAEVKAIYTDVHGGGSADTDFFTAAGKTIHDADDKRRANMEAYHTGKLETALRKLMRLVIPTGTTPDTITPELGVERYREHQKILRDAVIEMLMDGADLGADAGIEQAEALLGVRKADITGVNWDLVNESVLRWVLGAEGGFGAGYGNGLMASITATSERQIRSQISEWMNNGLPYNVLLDNLERTAFSRKRAETIVTTEITRAYAEGNRAAWQQSNVVRRMRWNTPFDERVCPTCGALHNTTAPINGTFPGGLFPPAHPRCRCNIAPVVGEE